MDHSLVVIFEKDTVALLVLRNECWSSQVLEILEDAVTENPLFCFSGHPWLMASVAEKSSKIARVYMDELFFLSSFILHSRGAFDVQSRLMFRTPRLDLSFRITAPSECRLQARVY